MEKRTRFSVVYYVLGFIVLLMLQRSLFHPPMEEVSYRQFRQYLADDRIASLDIGREKIMGVLRGDEEQHFAARRLPGDEDLVRALEEKKIEYRAVDDSNWLADMLSWVLPFGLMALVWIFIMRRMGAGGPMTLGKSKVKVYNALEAEKVNFGDVAGIDEVEQELQEIIEFLGDPGRFQRLGGRLPKGVLLVGPPGTGKTLLARAVAGEAGVPFFSISGSEFVEMFVGVGASRVRDLFEQAKQKAPCVVFIDAIGRGRGRGMMVGGHMEQEGTRDRGGCSRPLTPGDRHGTGRSSGRGSLRSFPGHFAASCGKPVPIRRNSLVNRKIRV